MGAVDGSGAAPIRAEVTVVRGRYVDRTLQTASWYDVHELQPGTYPVELADSNWVRTPYATDPYYASLRVPTLLLQEYRVNRLFTASSSSTTYPNTPDTVTFTLYGYQLADGLTVVSDAETREPLVTMRLLADHPDRHTFVARRADGSRWIVFDDEPGDVLAACLCGWVAEQVTDREGARSVHADVHLREVADRYGCTV